MRRNVMICTATTLTAIAATALGGITAASASAATGVPTKLTGAPKSAIAVSGAAAMYLETGTGPGQVCTIVFPASAARDAKGVARIAIAVPAPAQTYAEQVVKGVERIASTVPASAHAYAEQVVKGVERIASAVTGSAPMGTAKPVLLAPTAANAACGVCLTAVPSPAPRYAKGVAQAPAGFACRVIAVPRACTKGSGPAKIAHLKQVVTCLTPPVATGEAEHGK